MASDDTQTVGAFISSLVEDGIGSQAFMGSTFDSDFILLAEFCEMEGPKPIFTIPSVFNSTFNLNTFAVRIMSVDCVSIMQTTDFTNFKVAGDIQVVLTEQSEGAVAYVHHFVLYDICARGFVRPFCLSYIMKNHAELLSMYEKICTMFTLVSGLFHFGNALSFINDLMLRLQHLQHLKKVLAEKSYDIFVDDKVLTESQKNAITIKALDDAMYQLHQLIIIFKSYVEGTSFVDHRGLFNERYRDILQKLDASDLLHSAPNDNFTDQTMNQMTELATEEMEESARPSHNVPSEVISSILGKKYDKRLRNLSELSDVTNDIGLDVLRYSLHVFTHRDLSLSNLFTVKSSKAEQASKLTIGSTEFPVLPCVSNHVECCTINTPSQLTSISTFLRHFLDIHKHEALVETPLKEKQKDNMDDGEQVTDTGYQFYGELSSSFLSLLRYTSISLPAVSASDSTYSKVGSFVNIPSMVESVDGIGSTSPVTSQNRQTPHSENSSADSYKDALCYPESIASSNNSSLDSANQDGAGAPTYCHSISVVSTDTVNIPTNAVGDDVKEMMKSSRIPLVKLRDRFSYLPHIVYSFFLGRPVAVVGKESASKSVSSFVYGLASMLPNNPVKPKRVCPILSRKLTIRDLDTYGIFGILKSGKEKYPIPMALRPYLSIVDLEKDTLDAPLYRGDILSTMFDTGRNFSERSFRKFIKQTWAELISEAYVRFTNQYTHALSPLTAHSASLNLSCDKQILNYFVHTLRVQILHAYLEEDDLMDLTTDAIRLNRKKCQTIPNQFKKKHTSKR
ncbi:guanine nucleotide exchange protein smcr8a-like [Clytia hemisphaerica]|uniref:UDENN FLCN/SMCR8-type domain-containing protein n=1 Tax=Clytia hemisphaerica TaxID=252671 RepID=A0A7M5UZ67_9CNID